MNLEGRAVLAALKTQPKTVADRLLQNTELLSFSRLGGFTYAGLGEFHHNEVVQALKLAAMEQRAVALRTKGGVVCQMERNSQGVKVTLAGESGEGTSSQVVEFELLDPDTSVRLGALETIRLECSPWLSSLHCWHSILSERPLSECELRDLTHQLALSPATVFRVITKKWRNGRINLFDAFPTGSEYYEMLVGPRPQTASRDNYVSEVLRLHHQQILTQNLSAGLRVCLPSSIRHDVSFVELLGGFPDDVVLEALGDPEGWSTPFALLGALQIAVARGQGNQHLCDYAAKAVERLCGVRFAYADGQDAFVVLPPVVRLCLRLIGTSEGMCDTPPYWRRLAAFVHCHFLFDILQIEPIDAEAFVTWCDSQMTQQALIADLLDMQREPMWRAEEFGPASLRSEVLGRLQLLVADAEQRGWSVPNRELIERTLEQLDARDRAPLHFCGPLEGHLRRRSTQMAPRATSVNAAEGLRRLIADLRGEPTGDGWAKLGFHSRLFIFEDDVLGELARTIDVLALIDREDARDAFFRSLAAASYIACSQPYEPLGDAIAKVVAREAKRFTCAADAERGFRVLLMASAAITDRSHWLDWLANRLTDYAFALPRGKASACLYRDLGLLTELFPVKEWRFGKARKAASAAIR